VLTKNDVQHCDNSGAGHLTVTATCTLYFMKNL